MTKEEIIEQIGEKLSPFTGVKPQVIADIFLEILNASNPYNNLYVSKTGNEEIEGTKTFLQYVVSKEGVKILDGFDGSISLVTGTSGSDHILICPPKNGTLVIVEDLYDENNSSTMPTPSSLNSLYGSKPTGFRVYFKQFDRTYTKSTIATNGWFITDVVEL